jgi:hypothetical protein
MLRSRRCGRDEKLMRDRGGVRQRNERNKGNEERAKKATTEQIDERNGKGIRENGG